MKKLLFLVSAIIIAATSFCQSYNADFIDLGQYIQRMYENAPFEGARIVENVDNCYLVSVVAETPTASEYVVNRKAEVKALSAANTYLNGSNISQNTVIHTKENTAGYTFEEVEDFIESRAMGQVQAMQILTTFMNNQGKKVYVFCKQMPMPEKPKTKNKHRKK